MYTVSEKINNIKRLLPQGVQLVAVSKFHPAELIEEAYKSGQRIFGESRVQELLPKMESLPSDIDWHFIGHLQSNKVKYIIPFISLIHSGDSEKIIEEINRCANKEGMVVNCLFQLHVAAEETKSGFTVEELYEYVSSQRFKDLRNIKFCGVMGMASLTKDEEQIKREFLTIKGVFDQLKEKYFPDDKNFTICSMGMSHDYRIAVECGSTMVRIGTDIFGERSY